MQVNWDSEARVEPPRPGSDGYEEVSFAPVQGKTRAEVEAQLSKRRLPLSDAERAELERRQRRHGKRRFTLLEVFGMMTVACFVFALSHYLPIHIYAGALGFIILLTLFWVPRVAQEVRIAWPAWWTMAAVYVSAAIAAVVGG